MGDITGLYSTRITSNANSLTIIQVIFLGITIPGNSSIYGGAISAICNSNVSISESFFACCVGWDSTNNGTLGGAIYVSANNLSVGYCCFSNCAGYIGTAFYGTLAANNGYQYFKYCDFYDCCNSSTSFVNSSATVYFEIGKPRIQNCNFTGNRVQYDAAGVEFYNTLGDSYVEYSRFVNNSGKNNIIYFSTQNQDIVQFCDFINNTLSGSSSAIISVLVYSCVQDVYFSSTTASYTVSGTNGYTLSNILGSSNNLAFIDLYACYCSAENPSPSLSPFPTPSQSPSPTSSQSPSPTPSQSPYPTPSQSPYPTPSQSPSQSPSPSPSPTPSQSPSPTPSQSPSPTPSQSPSPTPSQSPSPSFSPTPSQSPFPTPSISPTPSQSLSPTSLFSASQSFTASIEFTSTPKQKMFQRFYRHKLLGVLN